MKDNNPYKAPAPASHHEDEEHHGDFEPMPHHGEPVRKASKSPSKKLKSTASKTTTLKATKKKNQTTKVIFSFLNVS